MEPLTKEYYQESRIKESLVHIHLHDGNNQSLFSQYHPYTNKQPYTITHITRHKHSVAISDFRIYTSIANHPP